MFDKEFNEPNYQPSYGVEYDSYDNNANNKINIKKFLPLIIIAIILIIIIGFVIMFFGAQKEVNISLRDISGTTVHDGTITIRSSNVIVYGPEKGSNHTVTLMVGEYSYTVTSPDYEIKRGVIIVTPEKENEVITLEKNIVANMEVIEKIEKIFDGQTLSGKILVDQVQTDIVNQEIIASDSGNLLEIKLDPSKININQNGATTIDYTISVKKKDLTNSVDTKITFSLKGSRIKTDLTINVNPTVKISEFVESRAERTKIISDEKLEAGEQKQILLTFTNNNRNVDVENIEFEIIPDIGYENKLEWFSFSNDGIINKIEKNKKTNTIQLRINVPITAQINDDFKGTLILTSNSLEEKKEYILNFIVSTAANVDLKLTKTDLTRTICNPECQLIQTIAQNVELNNTGDGDATNILIELDPIKAPEECFDWFDIKIANIDSIPSKSKIKLDIDIQPLFITQSSFTTCYLKISYTDPTKTDRQIMGGNAYLRIQTDYRET
jgi:hypothetical protein